MSDEASPWLREMFLRRRITAAQRRAGDLFRYDWQARQSAPRHARADRVAAGRGEFDMLVHRIQRGKRAEELLLRWHGEVGVALAVGVLVEDRTAAELAEQRGWRVTSPMDVLLSCLDLLAGFYRTAVAGADQAA